MDLFIEFHRLVMHSWSSSKSLCGSDLALFLTGGLTRDCAMSVQWEFEHKITSWNPQPKLWLVCGKTCALSTRPGSHPYVPSRVGAFGLADHSMVSIHGWRHGHPTKKLQFCFARTVWRWLPRIVDRSQVLPETIYESGCGHQEGDFVLRFSSHTHRTIVSQTPSQEQIQLRPAEKCLAA